jgi:predicted Fe-Mo cluster-binding NifX family protein
MKVALTVWENRVSPLFDGACMLLIADIDGCGINKKRLEPIEYKSPYLRVARLDDLGVNILICGGISDFYANHIEARGIKIVPFAAGSVDEVLEAYVNGNIYRKDYRMPGCEIGNDPEF